jgi:phage-related protein
MATEAADLIIKVRVSGGAQATAELLAVDKAVDSAADSAISAKPPMDSFGGSLGGIGTNVGLIAGAVALLGPSIGALGATLGGLVAATPGVIGLGGAFAYVGVEAIKAKTGAEDLGEAFEKLTKAGTPIGKALAELKNAAKPMFDEMFRFINTIGPEVIGTFTKLVGVLEQHLGPILKVISKETEKWGAIWVKSAKLVGPLIGPLFESFSKTLRLLVDAFLPAIKPAIGALIDIWEGLGKGLIRWFKPMIPTIKVFGRALGDFLKLLGGQFGKAFDDSKKQIKAFWDILGSLMKLLGPLFDAFSKALEVVLPPLSKLIDELVRFLVPIIKDMGKEFARLLKEFLPPFARALIQLLRAFRPLIPVITKLAKQAMRLWMDQLLAVMPFIIDVIKAVAWLARQIRRWVRDAGQAWEDFKRGVQLMKDWVIEKWQSLVAWFRGIKEKILGAIGNVYTWFKNLGTQLWQGFLDGMRQKWTEVSNWFGDRWEDIKNLPAKLLEVFSPSRYMRRIGQNVALGLALGLKDEGANVHRTWEDVVRGIGGDVGVGVRGRGGRAAVQGARGRIHGTLRIVGTDRLYAVIDARVDEGLAAHGRYEKRRSRTKVEAMARPEVGAM